DAVGGRSRRCWDRFWLVVGRQLGAFLSLSLRAVDEILVLKYGQVRLSSERAGRLEPGYSHARLTRQQSDASPTQTMAVMNSDDGLVGTVQQASQPPEKSRAGIGTAPMLVLN